MSEQWAVLVDELRADGHPDPMSYTPRQAVAWAELARERDRRRKYEDYRLMRAAMHGDEKAQEEIERLYGEAN